MAAMVTVSITSPPPPPVVMMPVVTTGDVSKALDEGVVTEVMSTSNRNKTAEIIIDLIMLWLIYLHTLANNVRISLSIKIYYRQMSELVVLTCNNEELYYLAEAECM